MLQAEGHDRNDDQLDDNFILANEQLVTPQDSRFRRSNRLSSSAEFSRVFKQAQRSRDKMFTVLYRRNAENTARLGLAISKKHCKLATGRNRLKRLVRESFRQHQTALGGVDIVVLNQPAAAKTDNKTLSDSLQKHWRKCQLNTHGSAEH